MRNLRHGSLHIGVSIGRPNIKCFREISRELSWFKNIYQKNSFSICLSWNAVMYSRCKIQFISVDRPYIGLFIHVYYIVL